MNPEKHVAEFRHDGYGLEHPPECRTKGSLLDCPVNLACNREQTAPVLGRWYVSVDDGGWLIVEEKVMTK